MSYVVALSGGIASGKSTVANLFAQLGVPIIDADIIARQVVEKGSIALNKITDYFGHTVLQPNGELDRAQLRNIVFNQPDQLLWLNNLLHPIIRQETEKQLQVATAPYVLWVVPLLIENQLQNKPDRILIVDVNDDMQIERLKKRDKIDENLAKKMLSSQVSNQVRLSYADDVIHNNLSYEDLQSQVSLLHEKYLALSKDKH